MNCKHGSSIFRTISLIATAWTVLASSTWADVTVTETDDEHSDKLIVARMNVTPAAEPVPALRHRLVARELDLKPGNAAPYYYRAHADYRRADDAFRQQFSVDELNNWFTPENGTPIGSLPLERVRAANQLFNSFVEGNLARAVDQRDCDWQLGIEEVRGTEFFTFEIEEFQQARAMSRVLSMRTRLAVAERRYDDAVDTMRMNYRLAHDVASEPLLVCGLIGCAVTNMTNCTLLELIAAPDSPNFYWAISELPQPVIDMRRAVRFDMGMGPRVFPFIHDAETTDRSADEWNRLYRQAWSDLATFGRRRPSISVDKNLSAVGMAILGYPGAKAQLIAQGLDRKRVERMSVGQVIAIQAERSYQRAADEYEKLWYVPYWEARQRQRAVDDMLNRSTEPLAGGGIPNVMPIASLMVPASGAAREAQVRLERDVAALRVIEALRIYAAGHEGQLPARLEQVIEVPIPANPVTGQPFVYRLDGEKGVLELPVSDGFHFGRRYEITIRSK